MRSSALVVASAWLLSLGGTALPRQASAALRVPQVPILGSALQTYLTSQGEFINVNTDQNAMQRWSSTVSQNASFNVQVELVIAPPGASIGLYNAGDPAPALYELFPRDAGAGWFAVGTFRTGPVRLIVSLFDDLANFRGTTTYPGADRDDFGYYRSGPAGMFYSQDARKPGGDPQLLVFAGTGINTGGWWLALEDTPLAGSDSPQDFADTVLFVDATICACPVAKCSWGALKSRFR